MLPLRRGLDERDRRGCRSPVRKVLAGKEPASMRLDLPAVVRPFSGRLREAGMPGTPAQSVRSALSLDLVKPASWRSLYWTTRAVFVKAPRQLAFDRVVGDIFGGAFGPP